MYSCCLGEVLSASGPLYSSQDALAAGTVALVTKDWDLFKSGTEGGANFDEFEEAVRLGWIPTPPGDSPAGYDLFMGFRVANDTGTLNSYPEFVAWATAWDWARAVAQGVQAAKQGSGGSYLQLSQVPELWRATVSAWKSRGVTDAAVTTATDAFNRYFPTYLTRFGGIAAPAPVSTAAPVAAPDPAYPVGVELLLAAPPGTYSFDQAVAVVIGWRPVTVYTDGSSRRPDWQTTPASWSTVLPVEWRGGPQALAGIWGSRWVGLDPDNSTDAWRARADAALAGEPFGYDAINAGTPAFNAWLKSELPTFQPSGVGVVAPTAPPPPVPYIPGSQLFIPAPGSGLEPTIILPGATTPVPVSSLTPQQIATETPAQSQQYQPVTAPTPTAPTPSSSTAAQPPGSYAVPGGGYLSPGSSPSEREPAAVVPQEAGIGRGLLIGGVILAGVLLLSTRRRRVKGYRRY
jgi:hypothetical protein